MRSSPRASGLFSWLCFALGFAALLAASGCVSPERAFGPDGGAGGAGGTSSGGGGSGAGGGAGTLPLGEACATGAECASSFCASGVCCDAVCDGPCDVCAVNDGATVDGQCAAAPAGTDPNDACAEEDPSTCGRTGVCGLGGACALYAPGALCSSVSCADGVKALPDTCDGAGTCTDSGTEACAQGACEPTGQVCLGDCLQDDDCGVTQYCDPSGVCVDKLSNGTPCDPGEPGACVSGHCVAIEGESFSLCCDAACSGTCESCSAAHTGASDGTCAPVSDGADPSNECTTDPGAPCANAGTCDGAGACKLPPAGTSCGATTCVAGGATALACNGAGLCEQVVQGCGNYACESGACKTSCAGDGDCVGGTTCENGVCLADDGIGNPCQNAGDCPLGFCVDGVCCDSACDGACQACSGAAKGQGLDGVCDFVSSGLDPHSDCAQQPASSCGNDGQCNGSGACRAWSAGTVCASASCSSGTQYAQDTCNGSGTCVDGGSASCGLYQCAGSACGGSCGSSADCVSSAYCAGNVCTPKKSNGQACGGAVECTSGACADGFCCSGACGGLCMACSAALTGGTNGQCQPIASGADPQNECSDQGAASCGTTGSCNGAFGCATYPNGTSCAPPSCAGGVQNNGGSCSGGSCQPAGTLACAPYACGATTCKSSCAVNADCSPGNVCLPGGVCGPPQGNGDSCSTTGQCQSGFCVDGVCCDSACNGTCRSCNGTGTFEAPGTCGYIECGLDPFNECNGSTPICSGAGSCSNFACA
jgi:hypothetical protein